MKEIKNITQAKALVVKYRSITYEEIEKSQQEYGFQYVSSNMLMITGFGDSDSCSLCQPLKYMSRMNTYRFDCMSCIHSIVNECKSFTSSCTYHITYRNIACAKTTTELLEALKNRADYIENLINIYESKTN